MGVHGVQEEGEAARKEESGTSSTGADVSQEVRGGAPPPPPPPPPETSGTGGGEVRGTEDRGGDGTPAQAQAQAPAPAEAHAASAKARSGAGLRKRYLQLKPLGPYELPFHSDFGSEANRHPDLFSFVKRVFGEAKGIDARTWKKSSSHTFGEKSAAKGIEVEQLTKHENHETWFARYSKHADGDSDAEGRPRGISWETLDRILRKDHSVNEAEYTPNVYDSTELLRWNEGELEKVGKEIGFKSVGMWIVNMYHDIPWPLNDRVFSILVLVGIRTDLNSDPGQGEGDSEGSVTDQFIVVQLPVDVVALPDMVKNRSHHRVPGTPTYHRDPSLVDATQKSKMGKKLVYGQYASVEKVSREKTSSQDKAVNHWVMALLSDAKGVLPGFVQKKAIPGEIVKDVEYVYGFVGKK